MTKSACRAALGLTLHLASVRPTKTRTVTEKEKRSFRKKQGTRRSVVRIGEDIQLTVKDSGPGWIRAATGLFRVTESCLSERGQDRVFSHLHVLVLGSEIQSTYGT